MLEVSTDRARLDVDTVHRWLSEDTYWAVGRTRTAVERSIEHSTCFGAYADGVLVGFARLVTDRTTHAWLCDVYVDRPHRGRGIGTALVAAVDDLLTAYGVDRAVLATDDAHGVYERFGFGPLPEPARWLARGYRAERA